MRAFRTARGVAAAWLLGSVVFVVVCASSALVRRRRFARGDRVVVVQPWSEFLGKRGEVTLADPIMVHLDGEAYPMRFGNAEIASWWRS